MANRFKPRLDSLYIRRPTPLKTAPLLGDLITILMPNRKYLILHVKFSYTPTPQSQLPLLPRKKAPFFGLEPLLEAIIFFTKMAQPLE